MACWLEKFVSKRFLSGPRLKIKQSSHHGITHFHPPTNILPRKKFLHSTVFKILARKDLTGQGHYRKVKGQIKATPLNCTAILPKTISLERIKIPTPYSLWDIAETIILSLGSPWQDQKSHKVHSMMLHIYTPNHYTNQVLTSYSLQFSRYSLGKMLKVSFTNQCTAGQKLNQGHTMMLHTCTSKSIYVALINFLHLIEVIVFKIMYGQDFKTLNQKSKVKAI